MRRLTGVLGVAVASAIALSAMGKAVPVGAAGARALDGPQELARVKPTHFRGDLRLLPRTRPRVWSARPELQSPVDVPTAPGAATSDRVVQRSAPATSAPAPSASFAGLDFANWGSGWPPDPNGDVGPTYYVQAVNTSIGVFRKSDGVRVAAFTFDTFFSQSPTGTPCDNNNQTDPVVLYDSMADRWIIADIAWSNFTSGAMYECMAVSASGDPVSGGWYFYAWKTNNGGVIPDYPKLGVWPDGIYMSANDFATSDESFQHVQVWAFNRLQMEAGTAAQSVTFSLSKSVGGTTVFGLLPSNTRAATGLPAAGTPNYFASIWGSYNIRVWKFHVDWATTASSTFTGPTNVPISAFNPGPDSVPEQGGNDIDTLSYRLMMQNQYTNLSGGESLWLTHTVGNGGSPNIAQVRWYQLGVTGGTVAGSPTQQSTWAPDLKNRFMPSLAVDQNSDMAIGYSVSDASIYPAIRYAGRLVGDPSGTLGQGETSLIEGTGFQCCNSSLGPNTRWGDYSAMTIDPDGCRFWYTNEYYANQPTSLLEDDWQTRIGSFQFSSCGGTPPPTIGSFLPTSGTIGTSVTITGTNLTGATSVAFNGTLAGFTVDSATQIRATVPSGAVSGAIDVTTPGGTATSAASFTVSIPSPPAIDSFAPTSGAVGDAVTISGSNLAGAGSVKFQGLAADFSVDSDSQITATVPAAAASGRITVTTPVGTATSAASFTVLPGITGFSPLSGPPGASVAITGTSLASAASVSFNGATASFVVNSGTSITARVPAAATTGKISITTGTGTATSAADFTVLPKLKSFSPTSGTVGTSVAILGSGFSGVSDVAFNGVSSTLVTVVSATQVSAVVPSGATSGPISVTTAAGTATSSTSFLVLPRITGISPTSGIPGDHVTVTGDSFTGATAVRFRGAAAEFTVDSDSQITATVPAAAASGRITVTTPGGTATSAASFGVLPTVSGFAPTRGSRGTPVTITGTSLGSTTVVSFNGATASFTINSSTSLTASVPGAASTGKISVTTPGGTVATADDFTVLPKLQRFSPTSGPVGTTVTISGYGFGGVTGVKFGGVSAIAVFVISANQIQAAVPPAALTGPIEVDFLSSNVTSADSFLVTPQLTSFSPTSGLPGDSVTISGSGFTAATSVTFRSAAASFTVDSDSQITATVPTASADGRITVSTPGGSATSASLFRILPSISGFTPASGVQGTAVTITGSSLSSTSVVSFNGVSASFSVNSSTSVTASVPAAATTGKISVTTSGGTVSSTGDFTVMPRVRNFNPSSGPVGTTVTINGSGFGGVTGVAFNGVSSSSVSYLSPTQVQATVPAGATTGPISLTTPAGTATSTGTFTVS